MHKTFHTLIYIHKQCRLQVVITNANALYRIFHYLLNNIESTLTAIEYNLVLNTKWDRRLWIGIQLTCYDALGEMRTNHHPPPNNLRLSVPIRDNFRHSRFVRLHFLSYWNLFISLLGFTYLIYFFLPVHHFLFSCISISNTRTCAKK